MSRQIFIFIFFISCINPVHFSTQPEKVTNTDLASLDTLCDYEKEDGSCFMLTSESFEIGSIHYSGIDIVFVIDVSLSMEDTLQKIGHGFSSLTSYIRDFNWQMAFTTADHGDHEYLFDPQTEMSIFPAPQAWEDYTGESPAFGRFMFLQEGDRVLSDKILNSNFSDYEKIFYNTITLDYKDEQIDCLLPPYCHDGHEQPLRVLKSVISQAESTHLEFFNDDSIFVVFVVTDESERQEDPDQAVTALEVVEEFEKIFGQKKKWITYGISIQNDVCLKEQKEKANADYSRELEKLVDLTGGSRINICEKDYSPIFSEISKELERYIREIPLSSKVFLSKNTPIQVIVKDVHGNKMNLSWELSKDGKSIYFHEYLALGMNVDILYYTLKE